MTKTDAMILSVGGTSEPLVTSIRHHAPEYVCFFASQGTVQVTSKVREELGECGAGIRFETELADNENDLLECHAVAIAALNRVKKRGYGNEAVVVDYTGGTKNMSVALALATIEEGFCFSYIGGNRRSKNGVGIVENGHEKVYANVNPWDFRAVKERRQISFFFNACQFKTAREALNDLAERASERKSIYKKLMFIADGFYQWDLFRHQEALELFKKGKLSDLSDDTDHLIAQFAMDCQQRVVFLETLISSSGKGKIPCAELLLDLYANAERRFSEGKIDDAILRLYRLVEMMAQDRLYHAHGIETGNVIAEKIPKTIREEYQQKYKDHKSGKIQIPQNASYILLKELGDPLGLIYEEHQKQFLDVQTSRNQSYLAHGFKSSQESVYVKFREAIAELGSIDRSKAPAFPKLAL